MFGYVESAGGGGSSSVVVSSGSLTSGVVTSGYIGDAAVVSGSYASGSIASGHLASGLITNIQNNLVVPTFVANELISGVRAVCLNKSGELLIAMGGVSGRMPAIGVSLNNYLSGQAVQIFRDGPVFSTQWNFSGFPNEMAFVGQSGVVVTTSGIPLSSGFEQQFIGVIISHSGLLLRAL